LNVLLLGPQGAGKGTQAKRISEEYGIPHIASGEILRAEMDAGTELGRFVKDVYDRGDLVSDALMIELIPDEVAFERLRKRAQLEGRADDTDEAIQRRLDNYHRETEPLIEYYRTRGNVVSIRADRSENEVFADIQQALERVPA
jgi:adenylate kinase